jgi:hypothetical protein
MVNWNKVLVTALASGAMGAIIEVIMPLTNVSDYTYQGIVAPPIKAVPISFAKYAAIGAGIAIAVT